MSRPAGAAGEGGCGRLAGWAPFRLSAKLATTVLISWGNGHAPTSLNPFTWRVQQAATLRAFPAQESREN